MAFKGRFWAQKIFKKVKKRLATLWRLPLEGNFERQMSSFRRSKKIQKSEKKACQGRRNFISLSKPNQTNGETNDTKRTKNVQVRTSRFAGGRRISINACGERIRAIAGSGRACRARGRCALVG
jgi:hypothetical protein